MVLLLLWVVSKHTKQVNSVVEKILETLCKLGTIATRKLKRLFFLSMPGTEHFLLPPTASIGLFNPSHLLCENKITLRKPAGRGEVVFFQHGDNSLVLRHYNRGGLPARLSEDKYFWKSIEATRAWREYRLLNYLQSCTLPAPRVYAAHVEKCGLWYRADIITHCIDNTQTLAEKLTTASVSNTVFKKIGSTIRRFHDAGIDHVDLNANNILLDRNNAVYLIDFDHCWHRNDTSSGWRRRNLHRLHRSLGKFCRRDGVFYFNDAAWAALCEGYR